MPGKSWHPNLFTDKRNRHFTHSYAIPCFLLSLDSLSNIIYHNINKYIYFFVTHSLRDSSMYSAAIHRTVWETNNRRHQCHSTKQYQKRSDWRFMRSLVIDALTADAILHIKTCRWIIYARSMCTQTFTSPWQKRRCIRSKILCQPAGNVICINPLCRWKYSGIGSAPSYGRT